MKRPLLISLVAAVVVTLVALGASLGAHWSPKLGLDLAGGSEVVYRPAHQISAADMNTTVSIIRNRVSAGGVSGAQVNSQGGDIVVQLPGIKNPQSVINLIGETAELQFRPVLCFAGPHTPTRGTPAPTTLPTACSSSQYALTAANLAVNTSTQQPTNNIGPDPALSAYPSSSPIFNDTHPHQVVLVPASPNSGQSGLRYLLGPTQVLGTAVHSAQAQFNTPNWDVLVNLTSPGSAKWDALAEQQFHAYIAIDLDGLVESAPLTQPSQSTFTSFNGKIQITGNFTQAQAQNLALVLNYGSLPVALHRIDKTIVSPTLGKASLKAGLAAGIGALILVLIYMCFYYRILGVVAVVGLALTAGLLWAIISALGHTSLDLTLDLAGVTGLIVSIGITIDSYIVYFERLKDEARAGRSVRTSVDKGFRGAFRTVLAADMVSLAAAVVLYLFSVGTVKGFAFFLGLSTILDLFMTLAFTRPVVILLGRSRTVTEAPVIGIASGLAVERGMSA